LIEINITIKSHNGALEHWFVRCVGLPWHRLVLVVAVWSLVGNHQG